MLSGPGNRSRTDLQLRTIIPLMGVYDVYLASIAGRHSDGRLPATRPGNVNIHSCTRLLNENPEGLTSNGQNARFRDTSTLTTLPTKNNSQSGLE